MLDLRHPGTIADIGYDNGYLLAELDELGHTDLVGVEKNPTLASKVMYTSRHKWRSRPRWITGNGLSCFRPGQVQQAVMAGFGENQIVDILQRDQEQALACHRLVFCPAISTGVLRPYLNFSKNWRIVDEEIVKEFDRFYSVLCVERGEETNVKDNLDLFIGPFNMSRPHPMLIDYLEDCRGRIEVDEWKHVAKKKKLYCSFLRSVDKALEQKEQLLERMRQQQQPANATTTAELAIESAVGSESDVSSSSHNESVGGDARNDLGASIQDEQRITAPNAQERRPDEPEGRSALLQ